MDRIKNMDEHLKMNTHMAMVAPLGLRYRGKKRFGLKENTFYCEASHKKKVNKA